MGDNVEEWLLDTYTPAVKHYANTESIYTMNGFKIAEEEDYKNSNGEFKDKDSTGLMPYRIMGFRANGDELKVMRHSQRYNSDYIAVQVRNPDSAKIKAAQLQMVRKLWVLPVDVRLAQRTNTFRLKRMSFKHVTKAVLCRGSVQHFR